MKLTTAQIFGIGTVIGGAFVGGSTQLTGLGLGAGEVTAIVSGASLFLVMWGGIGTILTGQASLSQQVAAHIDDPAVKSVVVPAVANLPGVDRVVVNKNADAELAAQAASQAKPFQKIEAAKS